MTHWLLVSCMERPDLDVRTALACAEVKFHVALACGMVSRMLVGGRVRPAQVGRYIGNVCVWVGGGGLLPFHSGVSTVIVDPWATVGPPGRLSTEA